MGLRPGRGGIGDDDLTRARDEAAQLTADLAAELAGIIAAQEAAPPDDEHDVEGSSVGFERARVTALLAHAEARTAALDEALARRRAGTFGVCSSCGGPIGAERLEAVPEAVLCVSCATPTPSPHRLR